MTRFRQLAVPLLAITVGIGWLLQRPRSGVPRRLALDALAGIVGTLDAVHRLNRLTCVVGPFLLATSITSILRQLGRLSLDIEVPVLVSGRLRRPAAGGAAFAPATAQMANVGERQERVTADS